MKSLTLAVLRSPDAVVPPPRRIEGGLLAIGRDAQRSDWVLEDREKLLSRRHCEIESVGGGWQLRDLSSNGTFLNQAPHPLGHGNVASLQDGDRIRMGSYELEVRLASLAAPAPPAWGAPPPAPWTPPAPGVAGAPDFARAHVPGLDSPFGPADPFPRPMADHAPAVDGAWPPMAPSPPAAGASPVSAAQPVPSDWARSLLLTPSPPTAPPVMPPRPAPKAVVPDWPAEPATGGGPTRRAPPPPEPVTAPPLRAAGHPAMPPAPSPAVPPADDAAAREMLAVAVSGLRALLVTRSLVKREFRIEATVLGAGYNNPLKFAASDEQAVQALLDPRHDGRRAVEETVADLTQHQVAVLEATQAAARALLERLSPAALEAEEQRGGLFGGAFAEKRLWLAYKRRHEQLLAQLEDDFDSAFGIAFARAYESAVGRRRR